MKILTHISEIRSNPDFYQGDIPVACTAPFMTTDRVFIGLYGPETGRASIDVSQQDFENLKNFLYEPHTFRLAVHRIKRIWSNLNLGSLETHTDLILDTELMSFLLNSGAPREDYTLSHLVHEYLQENYPLWGQGIADRQYPQVMHEILAWDAYLIYQVAYVLNDLIHTTDPDLAFMYTYGEVPLVTILLDMTHRGIGVDGVKAAAAYAEATWAADTLYKEITGGDEVNLWNSRELSKLLRRHNPSLRIPQDVTASDLRRIALREPLAAKILEWRDLQTDLSFLRSAAGATRVHPEWNTMTSTGRIFASRPAVQNIDKERYRPLLVPAPGHVPLKADYKQLQMRLLANMSQDPELIKAFREGKDVHWLTVEMCGILGDTDKEKRDKAKEVNYGILFQMTAKGLAESLGTSITTAQGYINAFWSRYSVARKWLNQQVATVKEKSSARPYVQSYLGRRRRFEGPIGPREIRQAKATILQQSEAEILRMALLSLAGTFRRRNMRSRVVMVLHDAIWVEAPEDEAEGARRMLEHSMRNAVEMPFVTLEVEFEGF
jgi:DNA polymerase I